MFQQNINFRDKVFAATYKLRTLSLGQDRYRRRYWVLPNIGGLFVEGLESGEPDQMTHISLDEARKLREVHDENDKNIVKVEKEDTKSGIKQEDMTCDEKLSKPIVNGTDIKTEDKNDSSVDQKVGIKSDEKIDQLDSSVVKDEFNDGCLTNHAKDEFMDVKHKLADTKINNTPNHLKSDSSFRSVDSMLGQQYATSKTEASSSVNQTGQGSQPGTPGTSTPVNSGTSGTCTPLAGGTPCTASPLANSTPTSSTPAPITKMLDGPLYNRSYLLSSPVTPNSIYSSLTDHSTVSTASGSWFSILPKMPCDDRSVTGEVHHLNHTEVGTPGGFSSFHRADMCSTPKDQLMGELSEGIISEYTAVAQTELKPIHAGKNCTTCICPSQQT